MEPNSRRLLYQSNYDLLLYWVRFEVPKLYDGFALGKKHRDGRFQGPFQEAAYCQIFNLHGGLHLFQDKIGDVYKALDHGSGVRATITDEIAKHGAGGCAARGTGETGTTDLFLSGASNALQSDDQEPQQGIPVHRRRVP